LRRLGGFRIIGPNPYIDNSAAGIRINSLHICCFYLFCCPNGQHENRTKSKKELERSLKGLLSITAPGV